MRYKPSNPHGISFVANESDPDRKWAITLPEPVGSLIIAGKIWAFTSSQPPPRRLVGKRLTIHGGQGLVKITPLKDAPASQKLIELTSGTGEGGWRDGLNILSTRHAGKVLGSALLSAAFGLGRAVMTTKDAPIVSSYRPDSRAEYYRGNWRDFDGRSMAVFGDWSSPDKKARKVRWVWCFCDPHLSGACDTPINGFGGLWDLDKGVALRRKQINQQRAAS